MPFKYKQDSLCLQHSVPTPAFYSPLRCWPKSKVPVHISLLRAQISSTGRKSAPEHDICRRSVGLLCSNPGNQSEHKIWNHPQGNIFGAFRHYHCPLLNRLLSVAVQNWKIFLAVLDDYHLHHLVPVRVFFRFFPQRIVNNGGNLTLFRICPPRITLGASTSVFLLGKK